MKQHDWPGNVRELLHVVEAAMVVSDGEEIRPEHLPPALRAPPSAVVEPVREDGRARTLDEMERAHIELALQMTKGHRGEAAAMLGISERNLYRKIREYGLPS